MKSQQDYIIQNNIYQLLQKTIQSLVEVHHDHCLLKKVQILWLSPVEMNHNCHLLKKVEILKLSPVEVYHNHRLLKNVQILKLSPVGCGGVSLFIKSLPVCLSVCLISWVLCDRDFLS